MNPDHLNLSSRHSSIPQPSDANRPTNNVSQSHPSRLNNASETTPKIGSVVSHQSPPMVHHSGIQVNLDELNAQSYATLPYHQKSDPLLALQAVTHNPFNLEYVPCNIDNRKEVVNAALQQNGFALSLATAEECANPEIVAMALDVMEGQLWDEGSPLAFADEALHTNPTLIHKLFDSITTTYHDWVFKGLNRAI